MSQRSEKATQKEQELLAEEQAANPFKPSPVSYYYNADYDNISTPSTTYTIHLTKSATIITNPSKPTRCIYHNHDIFYDGDDDEELFPNEDLSNIGSECNVPVGDDFTSVFSPLFDADNHFSSSDDKSSSDEDVPKENFKNFSNPLFVEEIISTKIDPYHFNDESDPIESLLNQDTLIISSPKFSSLLEEFSDELAHIDLIPSRFNEADFDLEEDIDLVERLFYDNSSPRPPEEFNFENSNAIIKSFSPSPIPVEDNDSLMEETDLFLTLDDSMPPGIENDEYDFEGDILFLKEFLSNGSL
uniref:Reverse transcriptase domain-containing protein n=1 Tax=Tanacetum cinerariifolium TaxID=118510 RepID=A0A6L2J6I6_TANCI|nr:hypothetical protein [Tanacetum cinerariifolium]